MDILMKELEPKIRNNLSSRELLEIAGKVIGGSKRLMGIIGFVLVAKLLTSCVPSQEVGTTDPIIPLDSMTFPIHLADDSHLIVGCEGSQSVVLHSGETVEIPSRCGDVFIRIPSNGQVLDTPNDRSMGSADGLVLGGFVEREGSWEYIPPTGEISNISVSSSLEPCGQRTLLFKEGELNAVSLQFLIETGFLRGIDEGGVLTRGERAQVALETSDGMAIALEADSIKKLPTVQPRM